jgi:hypothetical protein
VPTSPTPSRVVVLDANVLFPLSLRDLLFRALEKGLYRLQNSLHMWDEVIHNLVESSPMTPEGAAYLDMRVQEFLAENDALVSGYEALILILTIDLSPCFVHPDVPRRGRARGPRSQGRPITTTARAALRPTPSAPPSPGL